MISLSPKHMILFSVFILFSPLQTVTTITSKKLVQPDDPRITQLLATNYGCYKQKNPRQFSFTRVQKCIQAPPESENTRTLASVFFPAKDFRCSATVQNVQTNRVFCVQGAHTNKIDRNVWFCILTPCD